MIDNEWKAILGWGDQELEELRISGYLFLRQGHYRKAILFFEALTVLDPLSIYDFQTLGGLYLQVGENEKALFILDQALRMQGDHLPTLLNKTKALFCLNRIEEASAIAMFLTTCPDSIIANDAEALIMSYTKKNIATPLTTAS
ncbi:tetratricopeptide repeat family protein [Chlamydia ibidis]|uniref:Tetratricopeptide repeat family protein n=2 Tax=Chlamydia ibidis TaxID=1405396 RepID=S7J4U1_9CHLA|nr:tetratricopeptide repeat family protein [Chlamydia ibidis]EPP35062.1 tetratricopeptide repeat family protein [Chlamydia ibidis]EQM62721.1 tetratricopeptide repeat family protein [Chlamydia ibidis 10-1398/6]